MKNVFIINSHSTFLTTLGVINENGLNDILLILVRNYKNLRLKNFNYVDASELSVRCENEFNNRRYNKTKKLKVIADVDAFIGKYVSGYFHLYAPHLSHPFWISLYTNQRCVRFSYMQEGNIPFRSAYVSKSPISWKIKNYLASKIITDRVWYCRPWFLRDQIKNISVVDSYANNEKYFKYLPVKTNIIKWPLPDSSVDIDFKPNHSIFIFDAHVKNGIMKSSDYMRMCQKLINENSSKYNYLKFHPGQCQEEVDYIISLFKGNGLQFIVLDNSIPFEYVIMSKSNLHIVGYGSSLLYLAYDYHHHVCCKDGELMQFKLYRKFRKESGCMSYEEYIKDKNG